MVVQAALAKETFALSPVMRAVAVPAVVAPTITIKPAAPIRQRNFRLIPGKKVPVKTVTGKGTSPRTPTTADLILEHREIAWRLALRMINRWGSHIETDELRSLTDSALCEAASRFRPDAGATFMTFYFYHLKGSLVKAIASRTHRQFVLVDDIESLMDSGAMNLPKRHRPSGEDSSHKRGVHPIATCVMSESLEDTLIMRDLVNKCVLATSKLRGLDREVIQRVYINGEDLNSLPATLGFSRGHIFRVRSRALSKLKRMIKV